MIEKIFFRKLLRPIRRLLRKVLPFSWIMKTLISMQRFNEAVYLCILERKYHIATVYLSAINWNTLRYYPDQMRPFFQELTIRMLEHRNYEYEEMRLIKKYSSVPLKIEDYILFFFSDTTKKKLLKKLRLNCNHDSYLAVIKSSIQKMYKFSYHEGVYSSIDLFYAVRHLLLHTYHNGEGYLVGDLGIISLDIQINLQKNLPTPSPSLIALLNSFGIDSIDDVKLLTPDWSALIGHNGHLHIHMIMKELGWWNGKPVLLAYKNRIANSTFLSLFKDILPTIILDENVHADVWHELASLNPFLGVSHQFFQFKDGSTKYWNDAGAMAVAEWERTKGTYPLRDIYDRITEKNPLIHGEYEELRKRWGMTSNDWFVCLHMRDSNTRNETDGRGESIRNATFDNYLESINYITKQGGWVIRMGSNKAPKLPKIDRVIDYTQERLQSPALDIHLMRMARMFIGTTSGFAYVASSFGIPTAMVNAISSVGLLWTRNTRFCLKHIHTHTGRMLSQKEITSEKYRWAYPTHESLQRAELIVKENSSDEILETVKEVMHLSFESKNSSSLVEKWRTCLSINYFYGASLPSSYFLEKHQNSFLALETENS